MTNNEGISWDESHNFYRANIKINGKERFLGYFEDPTRAKVVRKRVMDLMSEETGI